MVCMQEHDALLTEGGVIKPYLIVTLSYFGKDYHSGLIWCDVSMICLLKVAYELLICIDAFFTMYGS